MAAPREKEGSSIEGMSAVDGLEQCTQQRIRQLLYLPLNQCTRQCSSEPLASDPNGFLSSNESTGVVSHRDAPSILFGL